MNDPQPEGHMASHIGRRKFLATTLGGAAAWPLAARAQQVMPVIGFLSQGSAESDTDHSQAFRKGLNEAGFTDGRNVAIEYRWANLQVDRLPGLAADLVRRQAAVNGSAGHLAVAVRETVGAAAKPD